MQQEELALHLMKRSLTFLSKDNLKSLTHYSLLDVYRKKCLIKHNFLDAKRANQKYEDLRGKEMARQLHNMKEAQEMELIAIENAHRNQFVEFSRAWDKYMQDYEAQALAGLQQLHQKQELELHLLRNKIQKDFIQKMRYSKELLDMKKYLQLVVSMRKYDEADRLVVLISERERAEKIQSQGDIDVVIARKEVKLRQKQQMALNAVLK